MAPVSSLLLSVNRCLVRTGYKVISITDNILRGHFIFEVEDIPLKNYARLYINREELYNVSPEEAAQIIFKHWHKRPFEDGPPKITKTRLRRKIRV